MPNTPEQTPPQESSKIVLTRAHLAIFGLMVIALMVLAYLLGKALNPSYRVPADNRVPVEDVQDEEDTDEETPTDEDETSDSETDVVAEGISVDWFPLPEQTEVSFTEDLRSAFLASKASGDQIIDARSWKMGTVSEGEYKGYVIADEILSLPGMDTFFAHFTTLRPPESKKGKETVLLSEYLLVGGGFGMSGYQALEKSYLLGGEGEAPTILEAFEKSGEVSKEHIAGLEDLRGENSQNDPRELASQTRYEVASASGKVSTYVLILVANHANYEEALVGSGLDISEMPIVARTEGGMQIRYDAAAKDFKAVHLSGHIIYLDAKLSFWSTQNLYIGVPKVTLNGKVNTQKYYKGSIGGCGFGNIVSEVDINDVGELKEIGYATGNRDEKIYAAADYGSEYFANDLATWKMSNPGTSPDRFAEIIPAFYYQDEMDRWLEFKHMDIVPASECGKPVIYLYPEKTMKVGVKLEVAGGFSVTDPAYEDGWKVVARPNGELLNMRDGQTYPYLFWEGHGGMYAAPRTYWVVPRADVEAFLNAKLTEMNLNAQETADFIEFWLPKMTDAPFYKIGFHGTEVMDAVAPMTVTPRPTNVFRILMDYEELDATMPSNPPRVLPKAKRTGFTVIEWGGVLHHK